MNKIKQFAEERDQAFTDFVMYDSWVSCLRFFRKWYGGVPKGIKEDVIKAGVYKAVQECTNISKEVKAGAAKKCVLLGFRPTMRDPAHELRIFRV